MNKAGWVDAPNTPAHSSPNPLQQRNQASIQAEWTIEGAVSPVRIGKRLKVTAVKKKDPPAI
jgi:hypothetical protein